MLRIAMQPNNDNLKKNRSKQQASSVRYNSFTSICCGFVVQLVTGRQTDRQTQVIANTRDGIAPRW